MWSWIVTFLLRVLLALVRAKISVSCPGNFTQNLFLTNKQFLYSYYEDVLSASFPFGSYKQVFIAPEMALSSWSSGASISIFSSHLLFDEKLIDQVCL